MDNKFSDQPTAPLALFGGTFDPVHYGHLKCADEARKKLGLDTLHLVPAGTPPHRATPGATGQQRLEMLQLAITEFPGLAIDPREVQRAGPSYMVDTLEEIRGETGNSPLMLLIGQDAANQLHGWHRWTDLFGLAHIVILTRPDSVARYQSEVALQIGERTVSEVSVLTGTMAGYVLNLDVCSIDVSATNICKLIREGMTPANMSPDPVLKYIARHGLYLGSNGFTSSTSAAKISDTSYR